MELRIVAKCVISCDKRITYSPPFCNGLTLCYNISSKLLNNGYDAFIFFPSFYARGDRVKLGISHVNACYQCSW